jgi:hypothetical protein
MSRIGLDAKLYRSASLLAAADAAAANGATWLEVEAVKDITLDVSSGEADVSSRTSTWKEYRSTLKDASLEVTMPVKPGDTDFAAIRDAWVARTPIALAVMSGPIATTGEEGAVGNWTVVSLSREEPLEDAQMYSLTIRPASQMQWFVKAA